MNYMIAALAIFRIAHMIAKEEGPFAMFEQARDRIMSRFGRFHWLTNGIHCPVCISFWLLFGLSLSVIPLLLTVLINALDRLGLTCNDCVEEYDDERATT